MQTVTVDANALKTVLKALAGQPHEIRELLAMRSLPGDDNPIVKLIQNYNEQAQAHNDAIRHMGQSG